MKRRVLLQAPIGDVNCVFVRVGGLRADDAAIAAATDLTLTQIQALAPDDLAAIINAMGERP